MMCARNNCCIRSHDHSNDTNIVKFFNLPEKYTIEKSSIIRDDIYIKMYKMLHESTFNKSLFLSSFTNLLKEVEYSSNINNKELYSLLDFIFLKTPMSLKMIEMYPKFKKVVTDKYYEFKDINHATSSEFKEYFKKIDIQL